MILTGIPVPTVSVQPAPQAIGLVPAPKVIVAQTTGGAGLPQVGVTPVVGAPRQIVPAQSVTLISANGNAATGSAISHMVEAKTEGEET